VKRKQETLRISHDGHLSVGKEWKGKAKSLGRGRNDQKRDQQALSKVQQWKTKKKQAAAKKTNRKNYKEKPKDGQNWDNSHPPARGRPQKQRETTGNRLPGGLTRKFGNACGCPLEWGREQQWSVVEHPMWHGKKGENLSAKKLRENSPGKRYPSTTKGGETVCLPNGQWCLRRGEGTRPWGLGNQTKEEVQYHTMTAAKKRTAGKRKLGKDAPRKDEKENHGAREQAGKNKEKKRGRPNHDVG